MTARQERVMGKVYKPKAIVQAGRLLIQGLALLAAVAVVLAVLVVLLTYLNANWWRFL